MSLFDLINAGVPEPELIQLESGFFIFPGTETGNLVVDELVLLLHAFNPKAYVNDRTNPDYIERRDRMVINYEGLILMGIEDIRLPITAWWLQGLNPKGPRIIYLTGYINPVPVKPSEEVFVEKIRHTFHPSTIRLGGAELHINKNGELGERGCLNHAYKSLSAHFPLVLDYDLSWKCVPNRLLFSSPQPF